MRSPRTWVNIRHQVQSKLGDYLPEEPPVDVNSIAEALGAEIRYSPFDGEDGDLAGMLVRKDDKTIIGINSLHHLNRQRFTIAHELGHWFLHKGDLHVDRGFEVRRRDSTSSQAIDPDEIEANRFAAELLMPYDMVASDLQDEGIDVEDEEEIRRLAEKYQVSQQAMTLRVTHVLNF